VNAAFFGRGGLQQPSGARKCQPRLCGDEQRFTRGIRREFPGDDRSGRGTKSSVEVLWILYKDKALGISRM
jgi:hypothetical protein